jgi:putative acetyltransferase
MSVQIQKTQPEDFTAIEQVHQQAFHGCSEAYLVKLLHANNKASVSLTASLNGQIVAHILFSPVTFDPVQPRLQAVGLAPVAVLPSYQKQGIGSRLIREGLQACREAGDDAVMVLGNPAYYSRFGFGRARDYGLGNDYNAAEAFMVIELNRGVLEGVSGTVKYQPEFQMAGC